LTVNRLYLGFFLPPRPQRRYLVDVSRFRFIPPALAKEGASPPTGEKWSYEVKLDGFRVQLHKVGLAATLFGKNGGNLTTRFPTIAAAVITLPVRSCIIDGELIAAGKHGEPDFLALLHGRHVPVCVYAFDLLELDGRDLRDEPLEKRRARLKRLLARSKGNLLRFSDSFPDPVVLLAECIRLGLEGIVCKRKDLPYRSGSRSGLDQGQDRAMEGREPVPSEAFREDLGKSGS
jgi:bifunctional non-homologous end joining protein LigD